MAKVNTEIPETEIPETEKPAEEKLVTIRLPIIKDDDRDVFVRVNERTWLIKRGETVQVPECVVEVLNHSDDMAMQAREFQRRMEKSGD
jgi:hypothetical protein